MTTIEAIEELNELIQLMQESTTSTGHVGIALQAMALCREHALAKDGAAGNQMYNDPFYAYFQQASGDLHAQYPIRKNALIEALTAYRRYISPKPKGVSD